ncbi:hypothetical protein OWR29_27255 [Actinoplanes sp. Pm04-4]|uniref:Uncharacterized protein n=1 Tax=Paractinoplanes pyxinae TaxID=2997416 RepID=A0ABT4B5E3_9ACTN|nr:hypothetical protein [Actinoplanes pyxinae]MCY1141712.1 hypothetical protein [Actinoplanes pyxinae]
MAVTAQRITASTTPVALNTAAGSGERLIIKNTSANAADLGGPTVAAGAGFDLAAGATVGPIDLDPGDVVYAIRSAAADATLSVLRV